MGFGSDLLTSSVTLTFFQTLGNFSTRQEVLYSFSGSTNNVGIQSAPLAFEGIRALSLWKLTKEQ